MSTNKPSSGTGSESKHASSGRVKFPFESVSEIVKIQKALKLTIKGAGISEDHLVGALRLENPLASKATVDNVLNGIGEASLLDILEICRVIGVKFETIVKAAEHGFVAQDTDTSSDWSNWSI